MKELRLIEIYETIRSDKTKTRENALLQLLKILEKNSDNVNLKDEEYHLLLENVFHGVIEEKFLLAKNLSRSSNHLNCLRLFGSVVRAAVSAGCVTFRGKSVRAISSHIIQVLPDGSDLCEAIRMDYTRAFRKIWSYAPHIDHLKKTEWNAVVKFCVDSISRGMISSLETFTKNTDELDLNPTNIVTLLANQPISLLPRLRSDYIELIFCLESLLCRPDAPIDEISESTLKFSLSFLAVYNSESNAHGSVIAIMNKLLSELQYNDVELVQSLIQGLFDVIVNLWQTKSSKLAEELIIMCTRLLPFLARELEEHTEMRDYLGMLLEVIQQEYCSRQNRNQLQFATIPVEYSSYTPASNGSLGDHFVLSPELLRLPNSLNDLSVFLHIYIAAFIVSSLNSNHSHLEDTPARKKPKVDSLLDRFIESSLPGSEESRLFDLQVIAILLNSKHLSIPTHFVSTITPFLIQRSYSIDKDLTWVLYALHGILLRVGEALEDDHWLSIWNISLSNWSKSSSCDIASQLIMILVQYGSRHNHNISRTALTWVKDLNSGRSIPLSTSSLRAITVLAENTEKMGGLSSGEISKIIFTWISNEWFPKEQIDFSRCKLEPEVSRAIKLFFLKNEIDYTEKTYIPLSNIQEQLQFQIKCQDMEAFLHTDSNFTLLSVPILRSSHYANQFHPSKYTPSSEFSARWFDSRLANAHQFLVEPSFDPQHASNQALEEILLLLAASLTVESISQMMIELN